MSNRLRKFLSYFLMLSMVLSLTAALALVDGAVPAKAAEKTYTFTDRNGKEVTVYRDQGGDQTVKKDCKIQNEEHETEQ